MRSCVQTPVPQKKKRKKKKASKKKSPVAETVAQQRKHLPCMLKALSSYPLLLRRKGSSPNGTMIVKYAC
jgi:hypothetical protein